MAIMDVALDVDRIQHLLLIGVRAHLKAGQGDRDPVVRATT